MLESSEACNTCLQTPHKLHSSTSTTHINLKFIESQGYFFHVIAIFTEFTRKRNFPSPIFSSYSTYQFFSYLRSSSLSLFYQKKKHWPSSAEPIHEYTLKWIKALRIQQYSVNISVSAFKFLWLNKLCSCILWIVLH